MDFSYQNLWKSLVDKVTALLVLLLFSPLALLFTIFLAVIHRGNPFFLQKRIGQHAEIFTIFKFKTIKEDYPPSRILQLLRKIKLDELPQLLNIISGEMSWVGPRPDLPGYYDRLSGKHRKILQLKPGLTGFATLKFSDEESLLRQQANPRQYNNQVIFPEKVKMNYWYLQHISPKLDLEILVKTILLPFKNF